MKVLPTIETDRLLLTKLRIEDLSSLTKYANNKKIADNVMNIPYPYTEVNASIRLGYVTEGFKERSRFCFAILLKENKELIGEIGLHTRDQKKQIAELGYWIGEPFWNNGYANEAIKSIVRFGLDTADYKTIYATCKKDNIASRKVLTKNKMKVIEEKPFQLVFMISANEIRENNE